MSQKSYDGKNSLYLIPTPIGNLDDMTLRAINTLKKVDVLFCEDTRITGMLLSKLQIKKKLISCNNINEEIVRSKVIECLKNGQEVGLVTDRGTPIISDPGYKTVQVVIANGYNVIGLPGPTALVPALITSGIEPSPFLFYGFLNSKETKRLKELEMLKKESCTLIFYESPHRLIQTLNDIKKIFGERKISISREISKKYEEIIRGSLSDIIKEFNNVKGEFVLVVEGNLEKVDYTKISIVEHVNTYIKEGNSVNDSIKMVAKDRNVPKKEIYNYYHNIDR